MTQLKNKAAHGHSLNEMNDKTYKLRRQVINLIYEAKTYVNLPRIEVRIVSGGKDYCGYAYMGQNIVHIVEKYVNSDINKLRYIVFHEILHAVKSIDHNDNCYLMSKYVNENIENQKTIDTFKSYFV